MWANSIMIQLSWEELGINDGCLICYDAQVNMNLTIDNEIHTRTKLFQAGDTAINSLNFLYEDLRATNNTSSSSSSSILSSSSISNEDLLSEGYVSPLKVSTDSGGSIIHRNDTNDFIFEVPTSFSKCGYAVTCSPFSLLDIKIVNNYSEDSLLKLVISRQFPSRYNLLTTSNPGAEITGISVILRDHRGQPTGVKMQISKKWASTIYRQNYEADYGGESTYWFSVNLILRIPAYSYFEGDFGFVYNRYGNVPSYSHNQLSITGYSDTWTWHENSLASLGENMCFDVLGIHTRAQITDVRVELFDGVWANNVGGGEFFIYFGGNGSYIYQKEMDAGVRSAGPCLSNASFISKSEDDAITMNMETSGTRSDDYVRVFFHFRYDINQDMKFSRLAFFQSGADNYAKNDIYDEFHYGNIYNESQDVTTDSSCHDSYSYKQSLGYRKLLNSRVRGGGGSDGKEEGKNVWWFAFGPNSDTTTDGLGDRGYIIRDFKSKFGGIEYDEPAFSLFCDKFEISVPEDINNNILLKNDYIEFKLEFLVLPRFGEDFYYAKNVQNSQTLSYLLQSYNDTKSMIKLQAQRDLNVTAIKGYVENHYPIRVCYQENNHQDNYYDDNDDDDDEDVKVLFHIDGKGLGYVPIVICGLKTHIINYENNEIKPKKDQVGLWIKNNNNNDYELLNQSFYEKNDFYQTNYDEITSTYEIIYNIEILDSNSTYIGFGKYPNASYLTASPSLVPTSQPSMLPTPLPTSKPTAQPTPLPTSQPTPLPTSKPTVQPTPLPTSQPTFQPTSFPTAQPTMVPTMSDTLTIDISISFTTTNEPTDNDVINLKNIMLSTLNISTNSIKNFVVSSSIVSEDTRLRRYMLTTSYIWSIQFDIQLSLSSTTSTSNTDYSSSVSNDLSNIDATIASTLSVTISDYDIQTQLVTLIPSSSPSYQPTIIINNNNNNNGGGNNSDSLFGLGSVYFLFGIIVIGIIFLGSCGYFIIQHSRKQNNEIENKFNHDDDDDGEEEDVDKVTLEPKLEIDNRNKEKDNIKLNDETIVKDENIHKTKEQTNKNIKTQKNNTILKHQKANDIKNNETIKDAYDDAPLTNVNVMVNVNVATLTNQVNADEDHENIAVTTTTTTSTTTTSTSKKPIGRKKPMPGKRKTNTSGAVSKAIPVASSSSSVSKVPEKKLNPSKTNTNEMGITI
jgi:hypothetical protein